MPKVWLNARKGKTCHLPRQKMVLDKGYLEMKRNDNEDNHNCNDDDNDDNNNDKDCICLNKEIQFKPGESKHKQ